MTILAGEDRRFIPVPLRGRPYSGRVNQPERHHRPVRRADVEPLLDAVAAQEPDARSEVAAATAAAVITQGRSDPDRSFIDLADRVGIDTLAALWRGEKPSSLPGALWALYLLRTWSRTNAEEVSRLWSAGRGYAPAEEVVAGVSDAAGPEAVSTLADAVLSGAYKGDFAVALERAAAFFRVIAEGRRESAAMSGDESAQLMLADRNDEVARGLAQAAQAWRSNTLI
jgi:hypothetical protein